MAKEKFDTKGSLLVVGLTFIGATLALYGYHKAFPWIMSKVKMPTTVSTPPTA